MVGTVKEAKSGSGLPSRSDRVTVADESSSHLSAVFVFGGDFPPGPQWGPGLFN